MGVDEKLPDAPLHPGTPLRFLHVILAQTDKDHGLRDLLHKVPMPLIFKYVEILLGPDSNDAIVLLHNEGDEIVEEDDKGMEEEFLDLQVAFHIVFCVLGLLFLGLLRVQDQVVDQAAVGLQELLVHLQDGLELVFQEGLDRLRQLDDLLAAFLQDGLMLQVNHNLALHLEPLQHVVHMDAAHANQVAPDGIDVMGQMKGQEGDVNVLPLDGLDQVEHQLA